MELAIPLLALGGMYVISNQKSQPNDNSRQVKTAQENFNNMGQARNYLPNTKTPPVNYPVQNNTANRLIGGDLKPCWQMSWGLNFNMNFID